MGWQHGQIGEEELVESSHCFKLSGLSYGALEGPHQVDRARIVVATAVADPIVGR